MNPEDPEQLDPLLTINSDNEQEPLQEIRPVFSLFIYIFIHKKIKQKIESDYQRREKQCSNKHPS